MLKHVAVVGDVDTTVSAFFDVFGVVIEMDVDACDVEKDDDNG